MARDKIVARNVSMRFGDVLAIKDATCSIGEREFVAIIGPSGCGKSTFLYVIAGFEGISGGAVELDGEPIRGPGPDRGIVFQEFVLYPWRTVMENVTLGLDIKKTPPQEARRRAQKWITLAGLDGFEDAYPSTLS
ncbi:ABC transporter ATP-binding protein [Bordetella pertussis]|nr:ATP-binding cassette domain-containing protein [Bordetella pertussis]UEB58532.1 ATP-binding cassette domain-containing protein [Bordetella pertussis]URM49205.1 ATP-binding cassette domain-containing protein [Bordetella pertussis CS]CFM82578.1 ABC-transporter ATP-binding protein [Bordetella pertussis]CFN10563.1 ABC-transporter ATP-binding protein [Bordetella pertussis]CFN13744.1 ABC-transporter ATP-binding protein [Bordetella pertussis]